MDVYLLSSGAEGLFLSQFLLDGGSIEVPQHLYSVHMEPRPDARSLWPPPQTQSCFLGSPHLPETQPPTQPPLRIPQAENTVRHVDSTSLSEDEVFYN